MTTTTLRRVSIMLSAVLLSFQITAVAQTASHSVTQISVVPLSPNILKFGQQVTVYFNYDTTRLEGVRIWVRPMSIDPVSGADMLTPNYGACGSPLYPVGSGTGSCSFTITSGNAVVDKLRIQMWDASGTTLLFQAKLPVHFKFR